MTHREHRDPLLVRLARGAGYDPSRPVPFAEEREAYAPTLRRCRVIAVTCVRCLGTGQVHTTRDYTAICPDCDGLGTDKEDS